MNLFKEPTGKTSATRVAGFIALLFFAGISIFAIMRDSATIDILAWPWSAIIMGLFGVNVAGKFTGSKNAPVNHTGSKNAYIGG